MHKLLLIAFLFLVNIINAGTIVVQNVNDSGTGSLRQAIIGAVGGDTIRFNPNLIANGNDTIKLSSEIAFNKGLVFKGLYNNNDSLFISGQNNVRIFNVDLEVAVNRVLLIDSLFLIDGSVSSASGGAINFIEGDSLVIKNSELKYNYADHSGGGVYAFSYHRPSSIITLINSSINSNYAQSSGGGIYCVSTSGGSSSKIEIRNSVINENIAGHYGGGVFINSGIFTVVEINNSKMKGNASNGGGSLGGGAISASCGQVSSLAKLSLMINCSIIENNSSRSNGGAIYCSSVSSSPFIDSTILYLNIRNSKIKGNSSILKGGGVFTTTKGNSISFPYQLSIENSEIISNKSNTGGAGVFSIGKYESSFVKIKDSKVSKNEGGGVKSSSLIDVENTMVTENIDGGISSSSLNSSSVIIKNSKIISNIGSGVSSVSNSSDSSISEVEIINSEISQNQTTGNGGGIICSSYSPFHSLTSISIAKISLINSTVNNNTAYKGAGIYSESSYSISNTPSLLEVVSSTIYGNNADYTGGGIYATTSNTSSSSLSIVKVTNSTIVNNLSYICGGISARPCEVELTSSIVAFNDNRNIAVNAFPLIISNGYNILSNEPTGYISTDQINVDSSSLNLLELSYNGGETRTILPGIGSVALNMGNPNDNSDAQNGTFTGVRNVGATESCISFSYDTVNVSNSYILGDSVYYTSGIYYDSLITIEGCDSVITLFLTVGLTFQDTLPPVVICDQDSIIVFGSYEKQVGFYDSIFTNEFGCEVVVYQELKVNLLNGVVLPSVFICEGDSILIFGNYENLPGFYYDSLTNINGCDSIEVLHLIKGNTLDTLNSIRVCNNDSVFIFGNYESVSGFYYDSLITINGCDSIFVQELIVKPYYEDTLIPVFNCYGDSALIFGNYESVSGFYYNSLITINGCDSIFVQELIVKPYYEDTLISVFNCYGDSALIFGIYQSTSGFYYDSLSTIDGCDSLTIQELIIYHVDFSTSQFDLTLFSNQNGAFYQWLDCSNGNVPILEETNQSFTVSSNGDYAVVVTTINCSDTSECITINDVSLTKSKEVGKLSIYPNPNTGVFTIDFDESLQTNIEVTILNVLGEKMMQIVPKSQSEQIDLSSFENGVYFVKVSNYFFTKIVRVVKQ
jgi:predicted outer membrane repeat protein